MSDDLSTASVDAQNFAKASKKHIPLLNVKRERYDNCYKCRKNYDSIRAYYLLALKRRYILGWMMNIYFN